MIILSIVLGIVIPIAALLTILIALIIKNLAICFWRVTEGERKELKIKILTKLEMIK